MDNSGTTGRAGARALSSALERLRTRARTLLVIRRVGLTLGLLILAALVGAFFDAWLRFPSALRVVAWCAALALVVLAFVRWVLPALRFCPSLTDVALRVERSRSEMRGLLASALDLSGLTGAKSTSDSSPTHDALASKAVDEAVAKIRPSDALTIINTTPAARASTGVLIALVLALTPLLFAPALWTIGAQRIFTPWNDASWPKRTGVADATELRNSGVHSLAESLPVRAELTKWRGTPEREDVVVRYRTIDAQGDRGRTQRALLTMQRETENGYLFERLIEPTGVAMEYRLETDDDATDWTRVDLVEPPAVESATARVTPPVYTTGGVATVGPAIDLGAGFDERGAAPPALVGSRVDLEFTLNRTDLLLANGAVPSAAGVASMLGDTAAVDSFEVDGNTWRVSMTLNDTARLMLDLEDEYGIASVDPSTFRFDGVPDRSASATITTPERDMTVLPSAVVDVEAEGRDDVGLERVALERRVWSKAGTPGEEPSGPGGALEARGPFETVTEAALNDAGDKEPVTARVVRASVDLGTLDLDSGDEVVLVAVASDLFADASGVRRDPSRSGPRVLRIIDEDTFVREVREALAGVREGAIRIEQQQGDVREATAQRGAERTTTRAQAQLAQRLEQRLDELEAIAERVDTNRLDNEALTELLEEAIDTTERAAGTASEAAQQLAEARSAMSPEREDDALPEDEAREVEDQQRQTEQELAALIEMLDRGEDNWVVRNQISQLLDRQRELREQTGQLGQETAGQQTEELTEAHQRALEDIVQEQEELQQDTEELLDDLREREQAMRESDPGGAEGMRQAAQRAEQRQTTQRMEDAAEAAEQNQTSEAQDNQEQAEEALEEMLEDLDDNERNRREALQRALLSIVDSLKALIEQQESELAALNAGDAQAQALATALVRLADNTSAVGAQARAAGPELVPIANLLDRAVDAQADAIMSLRETPADTDDAREREERSLDLLNEALAEAEAIEEQLEQEEMEEKKRELKRAYRAALEMQIALRDRTRPFGDLEELSRRDRVRLRQLGPSQEEIGAALTDIVDQTEEMSQARVYAYAHRRLDRLIETSAEGMVDANAALSLRAQNAIVETLGDLLESLEDPTPEEQPFEDGAQPQEGGGEGEGGGAQPQEELFSDLGELRLLRELQIMIAEETSLVDAGDTALSGDLGAIAAEQDELAGVAAELVERITRQQVPLEFLPDRQNPLDDDDAPDENEQGGEG